MKCALQGKRILVTRAKAQAFALSNKIEQYGGEAVEVPLITFQEPDDPTPLNRAIDQLHRYKWIIFTSINGIDYFFATLKKQGISFDALFTLKIAVVGTKTEKELQKYGFKADLIPDEFVAESLLSSLKRHVNCQTPILIPRGNLARDIIPVELRKLGIPVDEVVVYETVIASKDKDRLIDLLKHKKIDMITFTSSSTVDNFVTILEGTNWRDYIEGIDIACIGPITAETVRSYHLNPTIVANEYSIEGLLKAITLGVKKV